MKNMKLPEKYKNWIEFATRCIELENKYPGAAIIKTEIINCDLTNTYKKTEMGEFNIRDVKAKAFDELASSGIDFAMLDVLSKYDIAHPSHLNELLMISGASRKPIEK
jgi:hypothetical protein